MSEISLVPAHPEYKIAGAIFVFNGNDLSFIHSKSFKSLYLWDGKGNCRCLDISFVEEFISNEETKEKSFHHMFKQKVYDVTTNIVDRRYTVEFFNTDDDRELVKISKEDFDKIKVSFLIKFEKNNPKI